MAKPRGRHPLERAMVEIARVVMEVSRQSVQKSNPTWIRLRAIPPDSRLEETARARPSVLRQSDERPPDHGDRQRHARFIF